MAEPLAARGGSVVKVPSGDMPRPILKKQPSNKFTEADTDADGATMGRTPSGNRCRFSAVIQEELEFTSTMSDESSSNSPSPEDDRGGSHFSQWGVSRRDEEDSDEDEDEDSEEDDRRRRPENPFMRELFELHRSLAPRLERLESVIQDLGRARAHKAWARGSFMKGIAGSRESVSKLKTVVCSQRDDDANALRESASEKERSDAPAYKAVAAETELRAVRAELELRALRAEQELAMINPVRPVRPVRPNGGGGYDF